MAREDIIQSIEKLMYLLGEKENIKYHKEKLENKGIGMIKFLILCSVFIYPLGIMIYVDGENLASAASIISNLYIEKEALSFNSFKFMIIWTLIVLVGIGMKVCINTLSIPYIKNCIERLSQLEQNIKESIIIDNMNLYNYCNMFALNYFKDYLKSGRADSLKECMNYYNLEAHLNNIEKK